MDRNAIETLSIDTVRSSIVTSDYLNQFISDNDKEPSWDGFVYIYESKSKTKDKLKGRLPVQVKGTENSDFTNREITYPVAISDLTNYLYDGGIIYFVVYVDSSGSSTKIYYSELPPIKIRLILAEAKNQKTKSITFKEFPSDGNQKATIFLNCWKNCQKQYSFVDAKLYTLEELEAKGVLEGITTSVTGYGLDNNDPQKALITNEVYFYAQIKGSTIPQPLELIPFDIHTATESKTAITVNGIPFYDRCTRIRSKGSMTMKIGESFRITLFEDRSCKIKYVNSSKLRILLRDLVFQLAVLEAGQFELDDHIFPLDFTEADFSNFNIGQQRDMLEYYKKVSQVFDILGADGDIDLSKLTHQEKMHIDLLITAFIDKEPVNGFKLNLSPVHILKIADFKFLLAFLNVEEQEKMYNVYDFFNTKYSVRSTDQDGNVYTTSQFAILKAKHYLEITNIRFDALLPSYQCLDDNEQKYSQANNALLDLLNAYDTSSGSKPMLLKTAEDFAEWLMKADEEVLPYDIRCLNRLQVVRRHREFTLDEIKMLCSITENGSAREDVLVGAYLLLDNQRAAEMHYENLDPAEKESFKNYPIYYFWKAR